MRLDDVRGALESLANEARSSSKTVGGIVGRARRRLLARGAAAATSILAAVLGSVAVASHASGHNSPGVSVSGQPGTSVTHLAPTTSGKSVPRIVPTTASTRPPTTPPVNTSSTVFTNDTCSPGQLSATFGFENNAQYALGAILFSNVSSQACSLSGQPSVRILLDGQPLQIAETSGAGNTPSPPPTSPVALAANGQQPQAGVPIDWRNWCGTRGSVTVEATFVGWQHSISAIPAPGAISNTNPPCLNSAEMSTLGVDVVRGHDLQGFH